MSWTIYTQPKAPDHPPRNLQYLERLSHPFPRHKTDRAAVQAAAAKWDGVDLSHRKYGDGSHYADLRIQSDGNAQTWERMSKLSRHREIRKGRFQEPPRREFHNANTLPPINNPRYGALSQPSPRRSRTKAIIESHAAPPIERWKKDEWDSAMKRTEERIQGYVTRMKTNSSQYSIETHQETERAYNARRERIERYEEQKLKRIESLRHTERHRQFERTCEQRERTRLIEEKMKRRAPLGSTFSSSSRILAKVASDVSEDETKEEEKESLAV